MINLVGLTLELTRAWFAQLARDQKAFRSPNEAIPSLLVFSIVESECEVYLNWELKIVRE